MYGRERVQVYPRTLSLSTGSLEIIPELHRGVPTSGAESPPEKLSCTARAPESTKPTLEHPPPTMEHLMNYKGMIT
jgi:hypothetical protein